MFKYQITVIESDDWSGRKYSQELFDTPEEAQERIDSINAENTSLIAPSYYVMARDEITVVKV